MTMAKSTTDRNLLFGLMAVQMDFISRDVLMVAMSAWALDKAKPLGQILREQGVIDAETHSLLEAVVRKHLSLHDDDPGRSLANLSTVAPVHEELKQIADADLRACLDVLPVAGEFDGDRPGAVVSARRVSTPTPGVNPAPASAGRGMGAVEETSAPVHEASERTSDPGRGPLTIAVEADAGVPLSTAAPARHEWKTPSTAAPLVGSDHPLSGNGAVGETLATIVPPTGTPSSPGLRFHILRIHARGGLGEVFVAHDTELNREVALKGIRDKHADEAHSRARFLLEAEITGGLEHPGIVPVYGLGRYDDGRPYYAMRFIRGKSLKEAIARFHASGGPGHDPGRRALEMRQLLGRFIGVCNAIAYAHSRWVLHRDIKPDNILLGPFGETLVVDWGLAKAWNPPGPTVSASEEHPLRPTSVSWIAPERLGAPIGTPQYMSPEQAAGELDRLGPTSDVYGLGATLYALLTGKDSFPDRETDTVLRKVRRGEFLPPRRVNPRVPPALEAVCLRAMALKPEDRYASPRALANDLEHWLADEPVSAWREPWPARLARWGRRHRPLVAGVAALLVTAVVALTGGTVLLSRANARTEAQRRLADENYQMARQAVDRMLRRVGEIELADVPQVEPVRRRLLEDAGQFYREFLQRRGDNPAVLREAAQASGGLGDVLTLLGRHDDAEPSYDRAIALLTRQEAGGSSVESRRELARAHHGLGVLLKQANRFEESENHFRLALDLRRQLAGELPGDPAAIQDEKDTLYHLGTLLGRLHGRLREAEAAYREAVRVQRDLVAREPEAPGARRTLARDLNQWGLVLSSSRPEDAEAALREAQAIQDALAGRSPSVAGYRWDLARSSGNLGAVLAGIRPGEASGFYEKAVRLLRQLADDFPAVPDYRHELAFALTNLGMLQLDALGRPEAAEATLREALALRSKLVHDFPKRFDYRHRLAEVRRLLGSLLCRSGRHRDAEDALRADLEVQEQLVGAYPNVPEYQAALGCALDNLAILLLDLDRLAEARDCLARAIRYHRIALGANERNQNYRGFLRVDTINLAEIHGSLGAHTEAAAAAEELPRLAPDDPELYCDAARILARCAPLAASDPKLPEPQRRAQEQIDARRAVELLRKAFEKGLRNLDELRQPDYDPVRGREDFQKLLEEVKAASQTAVG
jgi:tetratricopeptide (TPR) repeat protein/tRNA A-37 threonylcarbamoyl transferase component Bud32